MIRDKGIREFVLFFRMDITTEEAQPTPAQMAVYMKQWGEWINAIASAGKLSEGGNHLSKGGKVLKPNNVIVDGPYAEQKESIAGYILIKADGLDEAVEIAKGCPILQGEGTSVEVREVGSTN